MIAPALEEEGERRFQKVYKINKPPRVRQSQGKGLLCRHRSLEKSSSPRRRRRRGASGEGGKSKKQREEAKEKERKAGGTRPSRCTQNT